MKLLACSYLCPPFTRVCACRPLQLAWLAKWLKLLDLKFWLWATMVIHEPFSWRSRTERESGDAAGCMFHCFTLLTVIFWAEIYFRFAGFGFVFLFWGGWCWLFLCCCRAKVISSTHYHLYIFLICLRHDMTATVSVHGGIGGKKSSTPFHGHGRPVRVFDGSRALTFPL